MKLPNNKANKVDTKEKPSIFKAGLCIIGEVLNYGIKPYWDNRYHRKAQKWIEKQQLNKLDNFLLKLNSKQRERFFNSRSITLSLIQNEEVLHILHKYGLQINKPVLDHQVKHEVPYLLEGDVREYPIGIFLIIENEGTGGFDIPYPLREKCANILLDYYQNNTEQLKQFKEQIINSRLSINTSYIEKINELI